MTEEELQALQEMNAKIQGGFKDAENYCVSSNIFKGRWYYNEVVIDNVKYMVNTKRQIVYV
jgi:hypothetical protein